MNCVEALDVHDRDAIREARGRKAEAIALFLSGYGVSADEAALLDQAGRDAAAALAHHRTPSTETWLLVVAILAGARP